MSHPIGGTRERAVEKRLLAECRRHGFLCLKFTSPARSGVPDRVIITHQETLFVEVKKPGEDLRPLQREMHARMRRAGAIIYVVDTIDGVDELMRTLDASTTPRALPESA